MTEPKKNESTLLWSTYLASSWLWCIGMFFPVMLYRDYGPGTWVLFAAPNVIGAASVPWVFKTRESSVAFVRRYGSIMRAFSWVTAAFQLYFIGWAATFAAFPAWALALALGAGVAVLAMRSERASLRTGLAVWVVSAGLMCFIAVSFPAKVLGLGGGQSLFAMKPEGLWLSPMLALGFLSNPFLDLTFHQTRQAFDDARAKRVFVLGFGGFFLVGLVFTYLYAAPMANALAGDMSPVPKALAAAVVLHMVLQATFTAVIHYRTALGGGRALPLHLVGAGLLLVVAPLLSGGRFLGMSYAELGYRNILVCYGLLAPAFLWVVALSQRSETNLAEASPFGPGALRAWLVAVGLAMPFYAGAVLFHSFGLTWMGALGVAAVLSVGVISRRMRRGATDAPVIGGPISGGGAASR